MSARAVPFHCPFCAEEDLRPSEEGHGAWECQACARAFQLSFLGLLRSEQPDAAENTSPEPHADHPGGTR